MSSNRTKTVWELLPLDDVVFITNVTNDTIRIKSYNTTNRVWINSTLTEYAGSSVCLQKDGVLYDCDVADNSGYVSVLYTGGWSNGVFNWISGDFYYNSTSSGLLHRKFDNGTLVYPNLEPTSNDINITAESGFKVVVI
jgi:hypothetical protein